MEEEKTVRVLAVRCVVAEHAHGPIAEDKAEEEDGEGGTRD